MNQFQSSIGNLILEYPFPTDKRICIPVAVCYVGLVSSLARYRLSTELKRKESICKEGGKGYFRDP